MNNISLINIKALIFSTVKTLTPDILNCKVPFLGKLLEIAIKYEEELAAQNFSKLIDELNSRVSNLEAKWGALFDSSKVSNKKKAKVIMDTILQALQEKDSEKISFYAGIISGELNNTQFEWDKGLREEFFQTITQLRPPELVILQAMYKRKPGEALELTTKGNTWLDPKIVINETTLVWLDRLAGRNIIIDASIENIQMRYGSPELNTVLSASAYKLSTFGRAMINYMLEVQKSKKNLS